ncbi:MAG TPA: sigma-70 family RNA polymerase sigma factor [Thermoanaerobaculia bacterium]
MQLYSFDDDYVRRLREGDRWTEEHFFRYFNELMLIKLRPRLPSLQDIDDVRQEVFARVFRALRSPEGLRDGRKLGSFVNSVCNNVLFEWYRAREGGEKLTEEHGEIADEALSVEEALVTGETKARVQGELNRLDSKDAGLLRSVFLEERDKDEICRAYGVDRDYLRVLLYRAKEKFRSAFLGRAEVAKLKPRDTETGKPSLHH